MSSRAPTVVARRARASAARPRIAAATGSLAGEPRDHPGVPGPERALGPGVEQVEQVHGRGDPARVEQGRAERVRRGAGVGAVQHVAHGLACGPVAAALVAEQVAEAARAGLAPVRACGPSPRSRCPR